MSESTSPIAEIRAIVESALRAVGERGYAISGFVWGLEPKPCLIHFSNVHETANACKDLHIRLCETICRAEAIGHVDKVVLQRSTTEA